MHLIFRIAFCFVMVCFVNTGKATILRQDSLKIELTISRLIERVDENPDSVIFVANRMLENKEVIHSPFFESAFYNLLATGEYRKANFSIAQDWCMKAINLRIRHEYIAHLGTSYTLFGEILIAIGEYDKALVYLKKALALKTAVNNPSFLSSIYCTIGNLYYQINELDSSAFFHHQALAIYKDENDVKGLAVTYNNLANIKYELDANEEAIEDYKLAHAYYVASGEKAGGAVPLMNIGVVYEYLEEPDSAICYYQKALYSLDIGGGNRNKEIIFSGLADAYVQKNQPDSAVIMFQRYIAFTDSIFTIEKTQAILEADAKFQTKEKEQLLVLEQEKSETLAAQDASKRKTIYVLLALFVIISLVVLYLVRNARQKLKLNSLEISIKNQEIDNLLKNQEAKSYASLLEGQNAERERIAQDLHDQLGGTLAAVKVHFSLMDQKIVELQSENRDLFDKVNEMLGNAVQDVRRISHDLASGYLSKLGLRGALLDLTNVLTSAKKLKVDFFMDENLPKFEPKKEQEIYAIIQELVSNTLKHANATTVDLQLNRQGETCNIMFEDNGVGFDPIKADLKGIGLKSLSNRVNKLDGKLTIDSYIGRGTIIIIEIPL